MTSDTTLTVSGTHDPLTPGEKVQVSSDGGANWADVTSAATTWSYTDPNAHGTSFSYQARVVGSVGNVGANTARQRGDDRHGGTDGAVDHRDPGECRRRHQCRRGLGRHAGGGRSDAAQGRRRATR